jgi:CSLREA domain-containing protein
VARERRRETLRLRRAGLAVTAALGATALLAPGAQANTYQVNTTADTAPDPSPGACTTDPDGCTLREAINDANSNGGDDTVTFASGLSGTIALAQGQLNVNTSSGNLTIQGPGAGTLTVSGEDATRIFGVSGDNDYAFSVSGLTLANANASGGGGAINTTNNTGINVADSVLSGNTASQSGGAISSYGALSVSNTTISGNSSDFGGAIATGGKYAQLHVSGSTISGNDASTSGGGVEVCQTFKYGSGGETVKHAVKSDITGTTISGNTAQYGAGMNISCLGDGDHFTVTHSTISGNDASAGGDTGFGGGIHFNDNLYVPDFVDTATAAKLSVAAKHLEPVDGEFRAIDSTISGNNADFGGGVSAGGHNEASVVVFGSRQVGAPYGSVIGPDGSIEFENSTIASNTAGSGGGGVYLNSYDAGSGPISPTVSLTSTILGDNTLAGTANDADRADGSTGGGLDVTHSLVENAGDVPFTAQAETLTGVDPQLGPLTGNGGPTATQMPAATSPAIDKGDAPARLTTDQRDHLRTVDGGGIANAAGGDGTDIGAVEFDSPAVAAAPGTQQVLGDRTPPKMTLKVPKVLSIAQLIAGFNVSVSCNEPCSMTFRLYASAPTGTLHSGVHSAGYNFRLLNRKIGRKAGRRKVHLRPCLAGSPSKKRTHVCRKRITASLFAKPQKRFRVKLVIAAKDKAGNVSHQKRFIRVHR